MLPIERQNRIIEYLKKHATARVEELAQHLSVSPMTIRRDLEHLEQLNLLTRIFGGAVIKSDRAIETPYKDKSTVNMDVKKRIAWESVKLIRDGQIVLLDSGTTTMEIAKLLRRFNSIKVVTTDVRIAGYLAMNTAFEILCAGGQVQSRTGACIGGRAAAFLKDLDLDIAFMGTSCINNDLYLCTPSLEKAEVKQAMLRSSGQVVLVTDSSKFQKRNFVKVCHLKDLSAVITDKGLEEDVIRQIQTLDIPLQMI